MRNYSIDDIRAFCAAVQSGQFTEASELLFITPSALSRRIANIELAAGGRVFDRSTHRLRLTPLGAVLYERLSPLLAQMDGSFLEATRQAKGEGGLVVAMVATVACSVLPRVLDAFHARHPGAYVSVRDGITTSLASIVEQRQAEFGITTHRVFGASIDAQSLGQYSYNLICCGADRRLRSRKRIKWKELGDLRVVGLNPMTSTRLQIDTELISRGIALPWTMEADQLSTLLALVRTKEYVTVLPSLFKADAGLAAVPVVDPDIRRELYLVKRKDASLSAQAETLSELLREGLR